MNTTSAGTPTCLARRMCSAGLRHRAVRCRDHQNRTVHLRRAGDHVFHIVGVAWTIDMGIMTILGFIFDMRREIVIPRGFFFRSLVDLIIGRVNRAAPTRPKPW